MYQLAISLLAMTTFAGYTDLNTHDSKAEAARKRYRGLCWNRLKTCLIICSYSFIHTRCMRQISTSRRKIRHCAPVSCFLNSSHYESFDENCHSQIMLDTVCTVV